MRDTITDMEWETRVDLAAAYRLVDLLGWSDLISTHISARVPDDEHGDAFLINPYGWTFDEITASRLVKINAAGDVLSKTQDPINPAGFVIHSAIHMARHDLACVLHTHTIAGTAVATQRDGLLPLTQHALIVHPHMATHGYEGVATDLSERARIVADLGDARVLFLANHGLLTVGGSVGEAFGWMYYAERACQMQIAIQQCGVPVVEIPDAVQTENRDRGAAFGAMGADEWPALRRKLDRENPGYDA